MPESRDRWWQADKVQACALCLMRGLFGVGILLVLLGFADRHQAGCPADNHGYASRYSFFDGSLIVRPATMNTPLPRW